LLKYVMLPPYGVQWFWATRDYHGSLWTAPKIFCRNKESCTLEQEPAKQSMSEYIHSWRKQSHDPILLLETSKASQTHGTMNVHHLKARTFSWLRVLVRPGCFFSAIHSSRYESMLTNVMEWIMN
jgi:hypothetical protein